MFYVFLSQQPDSDIRLEKLTVEPNRHDPGCHYMMLLLRHRPHTQNMESVVRYRKTFTNEDTSDSVCDSCLMRATTVLLMPLSGITNTQAAVVAVNASYAAVPLLRKLRKSECSSRRERNPCPVGKARGRKMFSQRCVE